MTNRKLFVLTAIMAVFLFCVATTDAVGQGNTPDYTDDARFKSFRGRLYIPDVEIDVALYRTNLQWVCDLKDAACYFDLYGSDCMLIADHVTQSFGPLLDVVEGDTAYINLKTGETVRMVCTDVFDGYDTDHAIVDGDRKDARRDADYLMYTCIPDSRNKEVRICLWDIIEKEVVGDAHDR